MKRCRQTIEELVRVLSAVETSWKDEHSEAVIGLIAALPEKEAYAREDMEGLLQENFDAGMTAIRLVLGLSKDEFTLALREAMSEPGIPQGGVGVTRFRNSPREFLIALDSLGLCASLSKLVNSPVTWRDILIERLRSGRGSAIKGQKRGRFLEDFVEEIVSDVFQDVGYDARCRFSAAKGESSEKTDFAVPSKSDPSILIECKAYGATGSKQTDILGDVERIVAEKRHDTHLLLVVDGASWVLRQSDLRKLIDWQNEGRIARIYTQSMAADLESDLRQLRIDHSLGKY